MPIGKEKQKLYPGGSINSPEWKAIRAEIRERAGDRCEWCKVDNSALIWRSTCKTAYCYDCKGVTDPPFCASTGEVLSGSFDWDGGIKIVCTTAHLNHDPGDNRPENLAFLCQRCHLTYDAKHHAKNAAETHRKKKAVGDLFELEATDTHPSL